MATVEAKSTAIAKPQRSHRALPLIVAAALVVACYACSPNFRYVGGGDASPFAGDFLQEWIGGRIVLSGDHARFYDPGYAQSLEHDSQVVSLTWDEQRYLPIVYPPFYYLLLSPLALLPLPVAAWLWAVAMVAALAASVWLLHRAVARREGVFALWTEFADRPRRRRQALWRGLAPWAIVAAVAFMPVIENFTSSQKGTVCLLILTATFLLLNRGRPLTAGLVFGLLAFKPQLTLVIAFAMLLKGQWRFVAGGASMGALLVGLCLLLGFDVSRQYFEFATGTADYMRNAGYDLEKSHCLFGFFTLLAGEPNAWAKAATMLAAGGVILLLVQMLRGPLQPGGRRFTVQYSALVIATVLLSPHLFTYDLTLLLLPGFLLTFLLAADAEHFPSASLAGWLLALFYAVVGLSPGVAARLGVQLTVPLLVSLLTLLAWQASRDRSKRTTVGRTAGPSQFATAK